MRAKRKKNARERRQEGEPAVSLAGIVLSLRGASGGKKMSEKVRKINHNKGGKDQERLGT